MFFEIAYRPELRARESQRSVLGCAANQGDFVVRDDGLLLAKPGMDFYLFTSTYLGLLRVFIVHTLNTSN